MQRDDGACSSDVQAFREDGAAWRAARAALEQGSVIDPGRCEAAEGFQPAGPASGPAPAACWALDSVRSPLAEARAVVLVDAPRGAPPAATGDAEPAAATLLRVGSAGGCEFAPYDPSMAQLADVILRVGGAAAAAGETGSPEVHTGGAVVLYLRLAEGAGGGEGAGGAVRWPGREAGGERYGDVWAAVRVCDGARAAAAARRAQIGVGAEGRAGASGPQQACRSEGGAAAGAAEAGEVMLVTAATRNYGACLQNLVGSVHAWGGPAQSIAVYDLGLSLGQRAAAARWRGVRVRDVPWAELPAHARYLKVYAWKVLVWGDAAARDGAFLFLDACAELRQPPRGPLLERLLARGHLLAVQAAETPDNIRRDSETLTHPATRAALGALGVEGAGAVWGVHCWAGLVGLDAACARPRAALARLLACARDARCIAPLGSNLSNHRFEQAALSLVARGAGFECAQDPAYWGFMQAGGAPSVALHPDASAQGQAQVVFARRRHPHKPYSNMVQPAPAPDPAG